AHARRHVRHRGRGSVLGCPRIREGEASGTQQGIRPAILPKDRVSPSPYGRAGRGETGAGHPAPSRRRDEAGERPLREFVRTTHGRKVPLTAVPEDSRPKSFSEGDSYTRSRGPHDGFECLR